MTVRQQGRIAGLIYLGVVLTGIFALAYSSSSLFGDDDPAATAATLAAAPGLLQANIAALFAMGAFFLALPFALARFLSPYGKNAARAMILLVAASLPFSLYATFQHAALASAGADLSAATVATRVAAYDHWMDVATIFWGLWLAPLGFLVLKSGAIPRILGVCLLLGCVSYVAAYFGPILYDGYRDLPYRNLYSLPGTIGEIGTCLWLLVMGARGDENRI